MVLVPKCVGKASAADAFAIKVMLPASGAFRGGNTRIYNGNTDKLIYAREFSRYSNCEIFRCTHGNVVDGQLFFTFYWFAVKYCQCSCVLFDVAIIRSP
jgi:hypothetical protein